MRPSRHACRRGTAAARGPRHRQSAQQSTTPRRSWSEDRCRRQAFTANGGKMMAIKGGSADDSRGAEDVLNQFSTRPSSGILKGHEHGYPVTQTRLEGFRNIGCFTTMIFPRPGRLDFSGWHRRAPPAKIAEKPVFMARRGARRQRHPAANQKTKARGGSPGPSARRKEYGMAGRMRCAATPAPISPIPSCRSW